jgi:molecular chaperone GrpE
MVTPRFPRFPFHARFPSDDPTSEAEISPAEAPLPSARAAPAPEPAPDRAATVRALRELEAAKARVERDAARVLHDTRAKLLAELLPVLDDFDRTLDAARRSGDAPIIVDGTSMVRGRLEAVLASYGLDRLDALGAPFDPSIHEAISTVAVTDPGAHLVVVDQLQPGYKLGERLLRPAKVVVGLHPVQTA